MASTKLNMYTQPIARLQKNFYFYFFYYFFYMFSIVCVCMYVWYLCASVSIGRRFIMDMMVKGGQHESF